MSRAPGYHAASASWPGRVIDPIRVRLPWRLVVWAAVASLPLLAFGIDGRLSRLEAGLLVLGFVIALVALPARDQGSWAMTRMSAALTSSRCCFVMLTVVVVIPPG